LIFPQQVEEANSRSWQNSGTLSIHSRKERIDQKHLMLLSLLSTFKIIVFS
jgi:hypothetical protein